MTLIIQNFRYLFVPKPSKPLVDASPLILGEPINVKILEKRQAAVLRMGKVSASIYEVSLWLTVQEVSSFEVFQTKVLAFWLINMVIGPDN